MNNPLISIIIVNYNGKKWLKKLFDSLLSQTYKNFEIIFVDNNSNDGSVDYIKDNYQLVKIVRSKNLGYGHACNMGAQSAKGDFLMFFNEDMYVEKDFIFKFITQYNLIQNKSVVGTIGCAIVDYEEQNLSGNLGYGSTIDFIAAPVINFDKDKIFHNTGCPLFITRSVFKKVGGFCENFFLYSEDVDLCWRLNLMGYKHFFLNDTYLYHYGGGVIGTFSPEKLSYYVKGEFNCIMNNYSLLFLPFALSYFLFFYISLSIGYVLTGKFKYAKNITFTILNEAIYNLRAILAFRNSVQAKRVISDWQLIHKINFMPQRLKKFLISNIKL